MQPQPHGQKMLMCKKSFVKIVGKAEAAEMSAEFFKNERLEFDFNVIYLNIINND